MEGEVLVMTKGKKGVSAICGHQSALEMLEGLSELKGWSNYSGDLVCTSSERISHEDMAELTLTTCRHCSCPLNIFFLLHECTEICFGRYLLSLSPWSE